MTATPPRSAAAVLDQPTLTTIHHKARPLVGRYGFTASDLPDIEQDLALDLLRRAQGYDPARAQWQTFVSRCIDHRIADVIRSRCCRMRHHERACVLDLQDERSPAHTGRQRDEAARVDLRIDVAAVLAALPLHLQRLSRRLMEATVSEIAAEDGRSRWRVYRDIDDLRAAFRAAGVNSSK